MKSSFFALASSILVAYAAAYTTPVGDTPQGNPITLPGADSIVPVGKPFTITWTPTSAPDTVTLVLLRGPGNNIIPMYAIAEKIPNTGTYVWTPSTDLEDDVTHYGIQLIDDVTGFYQYTTQFGVSNPNAVSSSISSVVSSTTSIDPTSSVLSSSSVAITTTTDIPVSLTSSAISSVTEIPAVSSEIISPEEATTVYHTNIVTVTSCAPTVSNCPARSTTVAPVVTAPTSAVIKSSTYWSNSTLTTTTSSSGVASTGFAVSTTALPSQFTGAGDKIRVGCAMGAVMVAAFALAL